MLSKVYGISYQYKSTNISNISVSLNYGLIFNFFKSSGNYTYRLLWMLKR